MTNTDQGCRWRRSLTNCKCHVCLYYVLINTHHNYSVNNVSLPDVTVATDLGVLVDNNLGFTKHYLSIVNKANHCSSSHFSLEILSCFLELLLFLCAPCWTIVVLYGHLFIKLISILLSVYSVVSLNVFLV